MVGNEPGQLYLSFLIIENHLEFAHALVLDPAKEWLESLEPASLQELISFSVIPLTDSLICLGGCWNLYKLHVASPSPERQKNRTSIGVNYRFCHQVDLPSGWFVCPVLGIYKMCTCKQSLTLPSIERVIGREESVSVTWTAMPPVFCCPVQTGGENRQGQI